MRLRVLVILVLFAAGACGTEGAEVAAPTPEVTTAPTPTDAPTEEPSPSPTASPTPEPTSTAEAEDQGCRNSTDPACGKFRFEPAVTSDDDVKLNVTMSPKSPEPGQRVTFTLKAADPDSQIIYVGSYQLSSKGPGVVADDFPGECPKAYGPWDPPKKIPGEFEQKIQHTYREEGKVTAKFQVFSHSYAGDDHRWPNEPPGNSDGFCIDPREGADDDELTFRVAVPPTPTPTATG